MSVRKLSLEEWFLRYQLRAIRERHFHLPLELNADVTEIVKIYAAKSERVPYTAILIKAAALLAHRLPYVNRTVFSTFYGERLVQFENVTVNVPMVIDADGKPHLSAITVPQADQMTIEEIRKKVSEGRSRSLDELPISRFVVRKKNTILNRSLLRGLHFFAYQFPKLYIKKGGGGIGVSSMMHLNETGYDGRPYAFGHNAFTLCATSVVEENGKSIFKIGVGYDHYAFAGNEALTAVKRLGFILSGKEPGLFES